MGGEAGILDLRGCGNGEGPAPLRGAMLFGVFSGGHRSWTRSTTGYKPASPRDARGEGMLGKGFTRGREGEALGGGGACGWRGMWDGARH